MLRSKVVLERMRLIRWLMGLSAMSLVRGWNFSLPMDEMEITFDTIPHKIAELTTSNDAPQFKDHWY